MFTETIVGEYSFTNSPDTKLGQGTYANVFKGKHRFRPDEVVAIKAINFDEKSSQDQKYLKQEITVMMELNHPNTIRMFTHLKIGPIVYVVMEYCAGRDLRTFLDKQPGKRLSEDVARNFMCQISSGLRYLHEKGIIHRDLKPQNILLAEDSQGATLKICDFGFARFIEPQMTSILGSPLYMAPEIMMGRPYTAKSDLWSVGCIFYEMLAGSTPLRPNSMAHLRQLVGDSNPIVFPPEISNHCKDLIHGLLQKKSSDRLDWNQFLSHPYLQRNEPYSKQAWLQHIYVFSPHGYIITLYLKPLILISAVKGALQNLTKVPIHDQLLIDSDGQVLQDGMPLEFYRFDQIEKPIYSIFWPLLRGEQVSLPAMQYKFELPFPHTLPESDLSLNVSSVTSMNDLQKIREFWKFVGSEFQHRYKNIKSRLDNVKDFKFQHDYQQEVYKVVRYHTFRVGNDLKQQYRSVQDLFEVTKKSAYPILKNWSSVIEQLRNTKIHPELINLFNANTLLAIVDEKKVTGYYPFIANELTSIENALNNIGTSVTKIADAIDNIDRTKLDDTSLKELNKSITLLEAIHHEVKTHLNSYNDSLKRTLQQINDIRSSPIKNDNNLDTLIKNFSDHKRNILSSILTQDLSSGNLLQIADKAKMNCTLDMTRNLEMIGRVLKESPIILKDMTAIRESISKLQPVIIDSIAISKLPIFYKDYINEIIRRKKSNDRMNNFRLSFQAQIQSELQQEIIKRKAFNELKENTLYLKSLAPLMNKLPPTVNVNLSNEDIALPDLGSLSDTVDDDFCFIEEGTTEEKLKRVEREKGELSEILSTLTKELTIAKQTIDLQNKQISSLNKPLSFSKETLPPVAKRDDHEPELLKEANAKLNQELQTLKKRNQLLVLELDDSSQKIKEMEQRMAQMEYSKPEIKSLLDMGFSIELVRKAFATTTTVEGALQWLLESSKV